MLAAVPSAEIGADVRAVLPQEGRYKANWKTECKLPWRKAGLLISMIQWTRASRLSIKMSLSLLTCGRCSRRGWCSRRRPDVRAILPSVAPADASLV